MRIQLPGVYMQCMFSSVSIFFTAMEKSYYPMIIQVFVIPFHAVWCYLFMIKLDFGMNGCAIAVNITYTCCFMGIRMLV